MNTAQSIDLCSAAVGNKRGRNEDSSLVFSASTIRTTLGAIANFGREPRCESYSTEKSSSRPGSVPFATMNLPTAATSYRTTDTRKEWEEPGEMTIRRTSKPCIGGATPKRDRADLGVDNRAVDLLKTEKDAGSELGNVRIVCGRMEIQSSKVDFCCSRF
jgi:hypothetical protein